MTENKKNEEIKNLPAAGGDDGCPLCRVSEETIKKLKEEAEKKKDKDK